MKTLKFASNLVPLILSGEKTSTWRLFDDKNLSIGDEIILQEFGKDDPFAQAVISNVHETKFEDLAQRDKTGHEGYKSDEEMYKTYSEYYQTKVGPENELKVIHFRLTKTLNS